MNTPTVDLSTEQEGAITYALDNYEDHILAISGPAGSGKTTLTKELVRQLEERGEMVCVSAATNKAALVLRNKGLPAITLHQATMKPRFRSPLNILAFYIEKARFTKVNKNISITDELLDEYGEAGMFAAFDSYRSGGISSAFRSLGITDMFKYLEGWDPLPKGEGVLIIDEASMIGRVELDTVMKVYSKIILVGDEYQLPPINSEKVFWTIEHRIALTEIHRQQADSQPLTIATALRTGKEVSIDEDAIRAVDIDLCRQGMPVIVWTNKSRTQITSSIRERLGFHNLPPQVGEMLICRNSKDRSAKARGLINNTIWKVVRSKGFVCDLENDEGDILEDEPVFMEELNRGNGVEFRFAYALTAHNSQGSEWQVVQIYEPDVCGLFSVKPEEARHWLYTAVTRAQERVEWVDKVA